MDVRREKSREKLRNALAQLLREQSLEQISIEQITDKAGVTRPTFYSNYQSRQDIIIEHVEHWLAAGLTAGHQSKYRLLSPPGQSQL